MKFEETTKNNFKKEEICGSMIYFLTKKDEVVYVGQSKLGMKRISYHNYLEKDFDNFFFINCKKEDLNRLENYYILKYVPKYNDRINLVENNLISYSQFYCKRYKYNKVPRMSYKDAKKIILENNLYEIKYKNFLFLNKSNLEKINNYLTKVSLNLLKGGK